MTSANGTRPVQVAGIDLSRIARIASMVLLGMAVPICLIASNTWYITNSEWLYTYDWWRNDIPARTGLPVDQLNRGADEIKAYFNNDAERLDMRVNQYGQEVSLYNEREIAHMVDVKGLFRGVFSTMIWTGLISLLILAAWAAALKRRALPVLVTTLGWSAVGTLIVVILLGVTSAIDFTWLFTEFHFISFANDLWELNPYTDYLLIMFPERFFMEATFFIAAFVVIDFSALFAAVIYANRRFGSAAQTSSRA